MISFVFSLIIVLVLLAGLIIIESQIAVGRHQVYARVEKRQNK
jgi:hypothetical protein